ncbi:unnamed protein product [Polarella glacialis]|uniref:ABC transporter domain-containing protein n=1 Tax=Polarella glacialis TaxID=89957 RepID=A0A813D8I0_POLGL|nr:unnamed protein product [Polarella glacialis]
MEYSAELYMQVGTKERKDNIDLIVEKLGLAGCADTGAGNEFFKGMSGGQKKRLSLGVALLKGTSIMFLDGPTSGLDAAAAASVFGFLAEMAYEANMIIVATIQQPSEPLFMSFSSVMFLANGRVAYHDTPQQVEQHCADLGRPLPTYTNPACHFMQLVNSDLVGSDQVDSVLVCWGKRHSAPPQLNFGNLPEHAHQSVMAQTCTLLRRQGLISIRDPSLYFGRMVTFLLANSFFAVIYFMARQHSQEYVLPRFFLVGFFCAVPTMFSAVAVYSFNYQFQLIAKEVGNGLISARSYTLATFVLEVPYMMMLALFAMVVPLYGIANGNIPGFFWTITIMAVTLWSFECMAQFFAVIFLNALVGMLCMLGLWALAFLFSGVFLMPEFVIWPLRGLCSALPLTYASRSLHHLEFHGTVWEGAQLSSKRPGFTCGQEGPCYGRTGDQVLHSLSVLFAAGVENTIAKDIGIILIIGVIFKTICFAVVVLRTHRAHAAWPIVSAQKISEGSTAIRERPNIPYIGETRDRYIVVVVFAIVVVSLWEQAFLDTPIIIL